jgi:hypothetical protein
VRYLGRPGYRWKYTLIYKINLKKEGGRVWPGFIWLWTMAATFEHCNKFTGPIKEVLDYLRDYQHHSLIHSWS